jgi:3-phosphoshikimate 1-carboxyvinyltransferase
METVTTETVKVTPADGLKGELTVPGDKSISHRAVILGSIADGVTEIRGFLEGEDTRATLKAFEAMGVGVERTASAILIKGNGMDGLKGPSGVIDAGNSGTTARLLAGLLSAQPFNSVITGDASLRGRPMGRIITPLTEMGASIAGDKDNTLLPLTIKGKSLKGITYTSPVPSAQLKSALLLAGLYAEGETTVIEPALSRDHTERMLQVFGADVTTEGNSVTVRRARRLKGRRVEVPGDLSSAAFFLVGAVITPGSDILIKGVGVNPTRTGVIEILGRMGADVEVLNPREVSGEEVADLHARSSVLKGIKITGAELLRAIDEFPIICVGAAFAEGTTVISGAGELRVKESDRVAVMAESLKAIGARCVEAQDGIRIEGSGGAPLKGGAVLSHGDHRIAMSMAIAALRTGAGVEIEGAGSVQVSFPGFFDLLNELTPQRGV